MRWESFQSIHNLCYFFLARHQTLKFYKAKGWTVSLCDSRDSLPYIFRHVAHHCLEKITFLHLNSSFLGSRLSIYLKKKSLSCRFLY